MLDFLDVSAGKKQSLDMYLQDFEKRFWDVEDDDSWKLERQQRFTQPGHPGWEAFARGDWAESMRLNAAGRVDMAEHYQRAAGQGFHIYRVRVAEQPVVPYLQWELQVLRQRDELGEHIRVIGSEAMTPYEEDGRLPELLTLGESTMYHIQYDENDALCGGILFTDPELVRQCKDFIRMHYGHAEPIAEFFEREISHLAPPSGDGQAE
jgi:hypothetical protein